MKFCEKYAERIYKAFNEKNAIQRVISRELFDFLQLLGFHISGDHFYDPIPNTKMMDRTYRDGPRSCVGIDFGFDGAEQVLLDVLEKWGREFFDAVQVYGYREDNYYFRGVDAISLYSLMREIKPEHILEVGQGFSTRIILAALGKNHKDTGKTARLVSIDPYNRLDLGNGGMDGVVLENIRTDVRNARLSLFSDLVASDLLFVDSSHVHKFGSDVEWLFEEVYTRVPRGVYIHVHDIFSPYNYPLRWYVKRKQFWNEQFHLENFLRFNESFQVYVPLQYLVRQSARLGRQCERLSRCQKLRFEGSSLYLRRVS